MILSPIPEIQNLSFAMLKAGQVADAKRVMQADTNTAIVELADGRVVCIGTMSSLTKFANSNFGAIHNDQKDKVYRPALAILRGFAKLGLITNEMVRRHMKAATSDVAKKDRANDAKRLLALCERLNVAPPALPDDIDLKKADRWA